MVVTNSSLSTVPFLSRSIISYIFNTVIPFLFRCSEILVRACFTTGSNCWNLSLATYGVMLLSCAPPDPRIRSPSRSKLTMALVPRISNTYIKRAWSRGRNPTPVSAARNSSVFTSPFYVVLNIIGSVRRF